MKKEVRSVIFFLLQNTLLFSLLFLFGESMNVYFHNRFVTLFCYTVFLFSTAGVTLPATIAVRGLKYSRQVSTQ